MRVAVIGHRGVVGSAVAAHLRGLGEDVVGVDRANYESMRGRYNVVVNAGGTSDKRMAATEPERAFGANVADVMTTLVDMPCELFIHISSASVYGDLSEPSRTTESTAIDPSTLTPYGVHKLMGEWLVRVYARRWLILRLGNIVGPGLRKNPIYDLLERSRLFVHPRSTMAFIDTRDVARILWELRSEEGTILNVAGSGTVVLAEVAAWLDLPLPREPDSDPLVIENVNIDRLRERVDVPASVATVQRFCAQWRSGTIH